MNIGKIYEWNLIDDIKLIQDAKFVVGDSANLISVKGLPNGSQATLVLINDKGVVNFKETTDVIGYMAKWSIRTVNAGTFVMGLQIRDGASVKNSTVTQWFQVYENIMSIMDEESKPPLDWELVLQQLMDQIELKDATIADLNAQMLELFNKVNSLESDIIEKDATIDELQSNINEKLENINQLNLTITDKQTEIDSLKADKIALEAIILNKDDDIIALNNTILTLNNEILGLEEDIEEHLIELTELREEVANLVAEVEYGKVVLAEAIVNKGGELLGETFDDLAIAITELPLEEIFKYTIDPQYPNILEMERGENEIIMLISNRYGSNASGIVDVKYPGMMVPINEMTKFRYYGAGDVLLRTYGNDMDYYESISLNRSELRGKGYQHSDGYEMFIVVIENAQYVKFKNDIDTASIIILADSINVDSFSSHYELEYFKLNGQYSGNLDFSNCFKLQTFDIEIDEDELREFSFTNCYELRRLPVEKINSINVTNFDNKFNNCYRLEKTPIVNMTNAETFENMFNGCMNLKEINAISNRVNTVEITAINRVKGMFGSCRAVKKVSDDIFKNINMIPNGTENIEEWLYSDYSPVSPYLDIEEPLVEIDLENFTDIKLFDLYKNSKYKHIDITNIGIKANSYDFSNSMISSIVLPTRDQLFNELYIGRSPHLDFSNCVHLQPKEIRKIMENLPDISWQGQGTMEVSIIGIPFDDTDPDILMAFDNAAIFGWTVLY